MELREQRVDIFGTVFLARHCTAMSTLRFIAWKSNCASSETHNYHSMFIAIS